MHVLLRFACLFALFFFSSRRRHTRCLSDWSSDVCSSDLTSDQLPDNFNAPFSIVRAASLYVVRTLIDDAIPMNDGCLRRSEERRVGKYCSCRVGTYDNKID